MWENKAKVAKHYWTYSARRKNCKVHNFSSCVGSANGICAIMFCTEIWVTSHNFVLWTPPPPPLPSWVNIHNKWEYRRECNLFQINHTQNNILDKVCTHI